MLKKFKLVRKNLHKMPLKYVIDVTLSEKYCKILQAKLLVLGSFEQNTSDFFLLFFMSTRTEEYFISFKF